MAVTMADISKLRQMTGAGMMDCKKALAEAEGDFDKAMEIIRKKGQLVAAKRSDRETAEGCVLVKAVPGFGAMIALKCETDFVAKNEDFVKLTSDILDAAIAARCKTIEEIQALPLGNGTVQDAIVARIGITGEKMELDGYKTLEGENIYVYNHQKKSQLCTMVALSKANEEAGHEMAMQIAASAPLALSSEDLDPTVVAKERAVAEDKAREEGKPENMIARIADGRIQKFYKEVCLLQQGYIQNEKISVTDYLKGFDKELTATGFQRFTLRAE